MSTIVTVVPVRTRQEDGHVITGLSVQLQHRPPMEDMYETITHEVVFESKDEADALAKRIEAAVRSVKWSSPFTVIQLAHWLWVPTQASPFASLQKAPTAQPVYRPATKF